jgi:hypothetical protein
MCFLLSIAQLGGVTYWGIWLTVAERKRALFPRAFFLYNLLPAAFGGLIAFLLGDSAKGLNPLLRRRAPATGAFGVGADATPQLPMLSSCGLGLMFLGLLVFSCDAFAPRLLNKIYPPEYWNEQMNSPQLSEPEQKAFLRRKRVYQDIIRHRFRPWAIGLFLAGAMLVAVDAIIG